MDDCRDEDCEDYKRRRLLNCMDKCHKKKTALKAQAEPVSEVPCSAGLATIVDAVPTNWCDPLLTGENAVVGDPPYDCKDIERLLNSIRGRIQARMGG